MSPLSLDPIAFRTPSAARTYRWEHDGSVSETDGVEGAATVVSLSDEAWADMTGQIRTFINLQLSGELTIDPGHFDQLAQWDPQLRLLHADIPIYDPAAVDLSAFDLERVFTLDDSDDDLRAFFTATGFLHVGGVFSDAEMAAANAEVDRLAAAAKPDDNQSWWVTDEQDNAVLCRLIYTTQRSDVLAALQCDPRTERLGTLLDRQLRSPADRMEGASVLIKVPGRTRGLANIPWHQDCGMGGHAIICPSTAIGIQLNGSSPETGHLRLVPGSHGQTLPYLWERQLHDVPVLAVNTEPGDVVLHVTDLMHASPEPTAGGGRRTMYVDFYPPALWDRVGPGEAFNDVVRSRTQEAAALRTPAP